MRKKSFVSQTTDAEELSFELDGETFICVPVFPPMVLLEYVSRIRSAEGDEQGMIASTVIVEFFRYAMAEDEYARFRKLTDDPSRPIELQTVTDIFTWLVEEYTNRPTQPPSS